MYKENAALHAISTYRQTMKSALREMCGVIAFSCDSKKNVDANKSIVLIELHERRIGGSSMEIVSMSFKATERNRQTPFLIHSLNS